MNTPVRIQRKRIKGFKLPPNTVCVTRGTYWGNPFKVGTPHPEHGRPMSAQETVDLFCEWLEGVGKSGFSRKEEARVYLRGKTLACFCKIGAPCHADILLAISNETNLGDSANAARVQASGNVEGKITTPLAKLSRAIK